MDEDSDAPAPYFVAVNDEIKLVQGLLLPHHVSGYHSNRADALREIGVDTPIESDRTGKII